MSEKREHASINSLNQPVSLSALFIMVISNTDKVSWIPFWKRKKKQPRLCTKEGSVVLSEALPPLPGIGMAQCLTEVFLFEHMSFVSAKYFLCV